MLPPSPDTATTLDTYTWPTCTRCSRNLHTNEIGRYACQICQDRARDDLTGIRALYPHLDTTTALIPRSSGHHTRTSTRTHAPLPVNVAVLDLTATGGVASRLQAIEDAWRAALGRHIGTWAGSPRQALPVHTDFLVINLERACHQYPEIADDLAALRTLHRECKTAMLTTLDPGTRLPGRVPIGHCPAATRDDGSGQPCGAPLATTYGSQTVHCNACDTTWHGAAAWEALRRAQKTLTAAAA